MPTIWELNAVVLCHIERFFSAATMALQQWRDPDEELLVSLVTTSSAMLWARSSFEAADREEEMSMAYTGAFISSVADRALDGLTGTGARAALTLAGLERQVRAQHDEILARLQRRLAEPDLADAGPARVNLLAWELLFPRFPHDASVPELCRLIGACLQGEGNGQAVAAAG